MRALLPPLIVLAACRAPGDDDPAASFGGDPVLDWAPADALPASAPGALLLARLTADDTVEVDGSVDAEMWVDVDDADDGRYAFRTVVLDASGEPLYSRGTPAPIQVRDWLGYYGDDTGYDILRALPFLGNFPVVVPLLEGAYEVRFQLRDADLAYQDVGRYHLSLLGTDEAGLSDAVVGWETLVETGDPADRLDLAIVGDGYTEAELDKFREDAAAFTDELLGTEPFASMAGLINVHRVDAVSAESGVSYDCTDVCDVRDTAFGTVFAVEWVNDLLGTDYNSRAVFQAQQWEVARAVSVVPWDAVLVIANTARYGGMAIHYATVTNSESTWTATGVHELAHAVGLLGDEYLSDECIVSEANGLPPNIADDLDALPWAHWVEADTPLPTPDRAAYDGVVGAFRGAYNCNDLYRPRSECRMNNSDGGEFCPVCAEQLVRRTLRFADPTSGVTVSAVAGGIEVLADEEPVPMTLAVDVDGIEVASGSSPLAVDEEHLVGASSLVVTARAVSSAVLVDDGELEQRFSFQPAE